MAREVHGPLVSCETTFEHLSDKDWVAVDCRYELADVQKGLREYGKAHIPGAFYADVGRDLSGPVGDGRKGRHPLPIVGSFQRFAGSLGIAPETQVVAYDDAAGQWASRLWWLLRYYGHKPVAVLDGGLTRWKALHLPLKAGHELARRSVPFTGAPGQMPTIDAARVEAQVATPGGEGVLQLVDVRLAERYRGEVEPVDKRAGHIPGAVSVPFSQNVASDLRWRSPDELRALYEATLGVSDVAGKVACYCGSGVTATHDVLAMEVAGMGTAALYPGSWSEWSWPESKRPIVAGPADKGAPAAPTT